MNGFGDAPRGQRKLHAKSGGPAIAYDPLHQPGEDLRAIAARLCTRVAFALPRGEGRELTKNPPVTPKRPPFPDKTIRP